jgi:predicted AAA+ superfamily ATPase
LQTTFEKDLETISDAYKLHEMPRLLRLLASQAANLFVPANLSSKLQIARNTVASYVGMLETIFLVKRIPAWRPGLGTREIQTPKIYVVDSGLLLFLLGANEDRLMNDDQVTGKALENFVAMELLKHAEWSETAPSVHHYRQGSDEVDLILENRAGEIVAIEVKTNVSLSRKDWRVLEKLRDKRGDGFKCGLVIHTGTQTEPLGDRLFAVPLSALWI